MSDSIRTTVTRAKDAATRFDRAVASLRYEASEAKPDGERRWLVGYEAGHLLRSVLSNSELLVDLLNADGGDEAEAAAKAVYETLRARRIAAKLEAVEGRTPEEAELFRAKARELRGE